MADPKSKTETLFPDGSKARALQRGDAEANVGPVRIGYPDGRTVLLRPGKPPAYYDAEGFLTGWTTDGGNPPPAFLP